MQAPNYFLARRRELGLTQRAIALRLNMTTTAVSQWENGGYPRVELYPRLAAAYETTVEEIALAVAREAQQAVASGTAA